MHPSRSITSSEAKASLGELLGSLTAEGPVEITRKGVAELPSCPRLRVADLGDTELRQRR